MQVFGSTAYNGISIVLNAHIHKYREEILNTRKSEQLYHLPQGTKHTFLDKKKGINKLHRDSILS